MLGFFVVCGLSLVVSLYRSALDLAVCAERLELDEVGTRLGGRIDQLLGQSEIAVMVDAGFGDDQGLVFYDILSPTNRE